MPKKDQGRLNISAPVGPIKSSRGPDLVRSDDFSVVGGIRDCEDPRSPVSNENINDNARGVKFSASTMSTRKVSAGFTGNQGQTANPTVASSSFHAIGTAQGPSTQSASRFLRRPSFPSFGKSKFSKSSLPASATSSMLPVRATQGENVPPSAYVRNPGNDTLQHPHQDSKLPKSRTMGVLHDLKNSISRQNLGAKYNESRRTPATSRLQNRPPTPALPRIIPPFEVPPLPLAPSFSRIPGPSSAAAVPRVPAYANLPQPWQMQVPPRKPVPVRGSAAQTTQSTSVDVGRAPSQQSTGPSLRPSATTKFHRSNPYYTPSIRPSDSFGSHSSLTGTRDPDQVQITSAQPNEYWTGRFSRLNDVYRGAGHGPETLLALRSGLLSRNRQFANPQTISEDDARHLHVFAELDFLCATPEAKQSLRDFQVTFARRYGRDILLPEGTTMGDAERDRGLVARFFGSRRSSADVSSVSRKRDSDRSSQTRPSNHRRSSTTLLRCLYGSGASLKMPWGEEPPRCRGWVEVTA